MGALMLGKPPRIDVPADGDLELMQTPPGAVWASPMLQRPLTTDGQVIAGKRWVQKAGQAVCVTAMLGEHLNETIEDSIFELPGNPNGKWGLRDYSTQGIVRRVIFRNVKQEHGRYTRLAAGYTLMHDILGKAVNSQLFQQRNDFMPESSYVDWAAEKTLHMRDWVALECCTDKGTRPAFIISPKSLGPNSDFIGENLWLQTAKQPDFFYNGFTYNSYGGICCELMRSVRLYNLQLELKRPRNAGVQMYDYGSKYQDANGVLLPRRAPANVEVDGGSLWGCNIELRPQWHDKVRIRPGLLGDGYIRLWTWQNGDWREFQTIPAGVGYSQG